MEKKTKTTNKTHKTKEDPSALNDQNKRSSWNMGSIFTGLLLVTIGSLIFLSNLGYVTIEWRELWRLWPLFVIAAGFSVLSTTHWLWKIVSVTFSVAAILAVIWFATGQHKESVDVSPQSVAVALEQGVTAADVTIKADASKLRIDSADIAGILTANLQSDGIELKQKSSREDKTQSVVLSSSINRSVWFGPDINTWDVALSESLPIKLMLDAGAASINADLSAVRLTRLTVDAGASSTVIKLGDKAQRIDLDIEAGASSTTLQIPEDSGVLADFAGGLSSRNLDGLEMIAENKYKSKNYDTAKNVVVIKAETGLSSFKIERY